MIALRFWVQNDMVWSALWWELVEVPRLLPWSASHVIAQCYKRQLFGRIVVFLSNSFWLRREPACSIFWLSCGTETSSCLVCSCSPWKFFFFFFKEITFLLVHFVSQSLVSTIASYLLGSKVHKHCVSYHVDGFKFMVSRDFAALWNLQQNNISRAQNSCLAW